MTEHKESPFFSDADMKAREELREMCKRRDKLPQKGRKVITEAEYLERRRLKLSCDGYMTLKEIMKKRTK